MPELAGRGSRRAAPGPFFGRGDHLREEALQFTRWFTSSKYALMARFLGELDDDPSERNAGQIRDRYCRALTHGQRVTHARTAVTVLLALGVVATAVATLVRLFAVPTMVAGDVLATQAFLDRLAAYSASSAAALVALRLMFDRYLERVDVAATFLAIELATCRR